MDRPLPRRRFLPACGELEHEIIVYDNASSDDTLRTDRRARETSRSVRERNDGFAAATNRAFARSRGRYVFLLNPDCELAPGALKLVHDFLDTHPKAAGAAPLLADDDGAIAARVPVAPPADVLVVRGGDLRDRALLPARARRGIATAIST